MGKVTLVTTTLPNILPMMGRSPGVHVSEIINDLCVRLGHYAPREEFNQAQLEIGNAFEWAMIQRLTLHEPERYAPIGEVTVDDIAGTPDLGDYVDEIVNEFKATWMSTKHTPGSEKFWKYEQQVKSYCYMMEWPRARLRVCHINGDYLYTKAADGTIGPTQYREYLYEFTGPELRQHWAVMQKHADRIRREKGR